MSGANAFSTRQQPIVLDSSSPSSPPRAVLSPYRFKPAHQWNLPQHFSSSPLPILHLPKKQTPATVKAKSRAEPITDGALPGFRTAREVAAELSREVPKDLKEDEHKDTASTKTHTSATAAKKGKKRKSDEYEGRTERHGKVIATRQREGKVSRIKKAALQPTTASNSTSPSPALCSKYFSETKPLVPSNVWAHEQKHPAVDSKSPEWAASKASKEDAPPVAAAAQTATFDMNTVDLIQSNPPVLKALPADKALLHVEDNTKPQEPSDASTTSVHKEGKASDSRIGSVELAPTDKAVTTPSLDAKSATIQPKSTKAKASPVKKRDEPTKAQAKSSRTVTGIVLAQFKSPPVLESAPPAYTAQQLLGLESLDNADSKPTKKKKKRAAVKSRTRALTPARLLSPEVVARRVQNQDTIFGTSSQLATEDSPRTIRLLQQAYRESEAAVVDLTTTTPKRDKPHAGRLSSGSRGLWSAGTRGHDDSIFSPEPFSAPKVSLQEEDSFEDIDAVAISPAVEAATAESTPTAEEPSFQLRLSKSTKSSAPRMRLTNASSFVMPLPPATVSSATFSTSTKSPMRPPLQILEAHANQALPAAPKPRSRSRKDTVAPTVDAPPKKPRGRPRKDPDAAPKAKVKAKSRKKVADTPKDDDFVDIDDAIHDPDHPPTPSPPRRRDLSAAVLPLDVSLATSIEGGESRQAAAVAKTVKAASNKPVANVRKAAADPENAARMTLLFPLITEAVKSAPRGTTTNPSWWEKMLLYDPIVLEDFAAWLISTGLPPLLENHHAEGEEKRLPTWMVQRWCEEHGVCCLWRQGLRGGVRARY